MRPGAIRAGLAAVAALIPVSSALAQDEGAPVWSAAPQVEAVGRATLEFPPNQGSFGVSYREQAATSQEASAAVIERANAVTAELRAAGGEDVRITANVSLSPYYEQVTETSRDGVERLVQNQHPDALLGYVATADLDITVLDADRLAELRAIALNAGPVNSRQPYFSHVPTEADARAVFSAAVEDAAARARIAAEGSGRRLGEMLFLTEGVDHCLGRSSGIVAVDSAAARGAPPPPPPAPPPPPPPGASAEPLAADLAPQRRTATVCAIYALEG